MPSLLSVYDYHLMTTCTAVSAIQVLWDAETGHPICGTPTANNFTNAARFFSRDSLCIATGGNYNLTVWEYNIPGNKLVPHEVQLGQMRRIVTCLDIDQDDQYMYCGTTTGDILQVRPLTWLYKVLADKQQRSQHLSTGAGTKATGSQVSVGWRC